MVKTLTKHGNSYALVIDKPILDLLKITPESPLEGTTDGRVLIVAVAAGEGHRRRVDAAIKRTTRRYAKALKKLAE